MKVNKVKQKTKGLSKSKQSSKPSINNTTIAKDINKSIKSTKKKNNSRIASSDNKQAKFSKKK